MSRTTTANSDFWSATISAIAPPFTVAAWINPVNVPSADSKIAEINSGSNNANEFSLAAKAQTAGLLVAYTWGSGGAVAFATSATMGNAAWEHAVGVWNAANSRAAYYNGANKATDSGNVTPTGINAINFNGQGGRGIPGQRGPHALFLRSLTDIEIAYLAPVASGGANGHPRALAADHFWKMDTAGTEPDLIGSYNLTVHGTTAGTSDPDFATFWTASALGAQAWTQGTPIASIDYTTKFEAVHSAYTVTHKQLGSGTQVTTASGSATTASRVLTLNDSSTFSAGDYLSNGTTGTRVQVLFKSASTVLLASPLTWNNADPIYRYPANALTFTGVTITSNVASGTPAAGDVGTYSIIPRATCVANAAIFMDGPAFAVTVAASGAAPSFSAGPTLTSANADGYTFGATSNQTATWYSIALLKGSPTPTAAQVKAGSPTGFVSRFSAGLTATIAGSLSLTALTNPRYDIYHVVDNGSGTSALSSFLAAQKAPPVGKQYFQIAVRPITAITKAVSAQITCSAHGRTTGDAVEVGFVNGMIEMNGQSANCTVIDANTLTIPIDSTGFTTYTSGGLLSWGRSMFTGASVVPATGDTGIVDVVTAEDGVPISPQPDGSVSLLMGAVTDRQSWNVDFYDDSGQTLVGVAKNYFQDVPPFVPTISTIPPGIFLPANQSILPTNVAQIATDVQGDTLTVTFDVLPTGISTSGGNIIGTTPGPTLLSANGTWTNQAGESATGPVTWVVGPVSPPDLRGLSQGAILSTLANLYLTATFGQQDDPAPAGSAIAQNPPFGSPVQPNTTINVTLSTGVVAPTLVTVPNVGSPVDVLTATAILTAAGFVAIIPQPWVGSLPIVQVPAAGSQVMSGSVVTLFLTGGAPQPKRRSAPKRNTYPTQKPRTRIIVKTPGKNHR